MFTNLIFLIITLLLISLAPEGNGDLLIQSPTLAFSCGLILYAVTLTFIVLQNRFIPRSKRGALLKLANLELIFFLSVFHFVIGAHRIFGSFLVAQSLFSLLLYFFGLWIFHYTIENRSRATMELRMLVPFVLPFLLFTILGDLATLLPQPEFLLSDSYTSVTVMILATAGFLLLMMLFIPPLIQVIWRCRPLESSELKDRLDALCEKAKFKHAGIRVWTALGEHPTAGIIGIFPRFRYVMFTPRILEKFHPDELEAILAHEIGHSAHRHLILYPFIIFGMMLAITLFSALFAETISESLALRSLITPAPFWKIVSPFMIFVPYAVIMAVYFRYVFGYFSRLFERQADLHGFSFGVPAHSMISALDSVAVATGNSHRHPSWHHHSIEKRIDFLREAEVHPGVIEKHHKRVKRNLWGYAVVVGILCILLFSGVLNQPSEMISNVINRPLQSRIAREYMQKYLLEGDQEKIHAALQESFQYYVAARVPGVAEFFSAKMLLGEGEVRASGQLMLQAWKRFDFADAPKEVVKEFEGVAGEIVERLEEGELKESLRAEM